MWSQFLTSCFLITCSFSVLCTVIVYYLTSKGYATSCIPLFLWTSFSAFHDQTPIFVSSKSVTITSLIVPPMQN